MANKDLTLAQTLNALTSLSEQRDALQKQLRTGNSFKNEKIQEMTCNRLLYWIATAETMRSLALNIASEGEVTPKLAMQKGFDKNYFDRVDEMRKAFVINTKVSRLTERIGALTDHVETFEREDHRRIQKEKSIATLKELGII